MLNSKFDLYKTEWLDVVFDDRNKAYGAYELRRSYGNTMNKAMATTFLGIGLIAATAFIIQKLQPPEKFVKITSFKTITLPAILLPKKVETVKPKPSAPAKQQPMKKVVEIQLTDKPVTEAPPREPDFQTNVIGPVNSNVAGKGTDQNIDASSVTGRGVESDPAPVADNSVHPLIGLEKLPEPVGGDKAWAKFLQKNLRYPSAAQDNGVSGRSLVSFIIEKNGEISNIEIIHRGGYGFDEEAARVLKMAKAWKPGIQNGQPVRVKFTIPINFTLAGD